VTTTHTDPLFTVWASEKIRKYLKIQQNSGARSQKQKRFCVWLLDISLVPHLLARYLFIQKIQNISVYLSKLTTGLDFPYRLASLGYLCHNSGQMN